MYNPQLKTFLCVADLGSFSKAAEHMYITAPAVIKQINLLEKTIGAELFHRTRRGLTLTDAGRSLYTDAKYIIRYCDEAAGRVREIAQNERQTIRVGVSPVTPGKFMMEVWPRIRTLCPNVRLQLIPFSNDPQVAREILKNLGQNIDVVEGLFDEGFLNSRQCMGMEIRKMPIKCALPVNHPLAGKEKLTVQDLHGQDFMLIQRGWIGDFDRLRDDLWKNHPKVNIVDFPFVKTSVFNDCENRNCLMVMVDMWENTHPLLKTVSVDWDHQVSYGILHSPEPSPTVRQFLEAAQSVLKTETE